MARYRSPVQRRKDKIRKRDRKMFEKRLVCMLCGRICATEIHHWKYSDIYDERCILEVCQKCHCTIHGRVCTASI